MLVLACVLTHSLDLSAQTTPRWRLQNRLQATYEFDNNIREAPQQLLDPLQDSSFRLQFHARAVRTDQRSRLDFAYRGGLQTYFRYSFENKLINELRGSVLLRLGTWAVGARTSGRLKLYLNDELDYATGVAEAYVLFPPRQPLRLEVAAVTSGVNYRHFSAFDYRQEHLRLRLSRTWSKHVNTSLALTVGRMLYTRVVTEAGPEDPLASFTELDLRDRNYRVHLQLNYSHRWLINLSYLFEYNDSQAPVFDYSRHQVIVLLGMPLRRGLWLRGYAGLQFKHYPAPSLGVFPIELDPERNESSYVVADLSKDLSAHVTALLRVAYHNNESNVRGLFYRKTLVTLGFDFRF